MAKQKAEKKLKPTKQQKTNWMETKTTEMLKQRQVRNEAEAQMEADKAHYAASKKNFDLEQSRLDGILTDIADIKSGNFTPPLPFKASDKVGGKPKAGKPGSEPQPVPIDAGGLLPITNLSQYGLSEKKAELLSAAVRSKEGGETIGHLESWMRGNEWWHRDVKGLGLAAVDKVTDTLLALRKAYPVPSAEPIPIADAEKPTIFTQQGEGKGS